MKQQENELASVEPGSPGANPPKLYFSDDLVFTERDIGGVPSYVCYVTSQEKYYHFGPVEYEAFLLLKAGADYPRVLAELQRFGVDWSAEELAQYVSILIGWGIARVEKPPTAKPATVADSTAVQPAPGKDLFSRLTAVSGKLISPKLTLFAAEGPANRLEKKFGWLFTRVGFLVWSAVVLSALCIAWLQRVDFGRQLSTLFVPESWIWFMLLWVLIKAAHEAGHAVAAKHCGVQVREAGILIFMLTPTAYVNISDAWQLKRRRDRVTIAMAGVYIEVLIASLALWYWWLASGEFSRQLAAQIVLLAGPGTLLVNANPLLRLDGYYALSDLLNIPNLRMHGRRLVGQFLERFLLGRTIQTSLLDPWRTSVAAIHAVCSLAFQATWMLGMIVAVSYYKLGLGILLAVSAIFVWCVAPLVVWIRGLRSAADWEEIRFRFIASATIATAMVIGVGFLPSPWGRRLPVVVQYHDQQLARAAADGFVIDVPVKSGAKVNAGDLLIELDDPELRTRRAELVLECEAAELKIRQLVHSDQQALVDAEMQRLGSLRRQLAEIDRQVDALNVRAERGGTVITPHLEDIQGSFVRKGQVLVTIADEAEKEVLVSIPYSDLGAYLLACKEKRESSIRLRGGTRFKVVPETPKPRLSDIIPHPALAAICGGPLPVIPQTDESSRQSHRTTQPRSLSATRVRGTTAVVVYSGQQGILTIGDDRSLWHRGWDAVDRWLRSTSS